jgi:hypothetical protein
LGKTFPSSAIADLNRYEVVMKLLEAGTSRTPFQANMLPPLRPRYSRKQQVTARSRERFATPRSTVQCELVRWMAQHKIGSIRALD